MTRVSDLLGLHGTGVGHRWVRACGLVLGLMGGGVASAGTVITFDELDNEAGIHAFGTNSAGGIFDVTKLGAETFHLSSPQVPHGYLADATLGRIGRSSARGGLLVNILESVGGAISDQVYVFQFSSSFTVIDFISDPDQFVTGVTPFATIVEDGTLQNVLHYFNDQQEDVSINIRSDVPEPASLALVAVAGLGLAASTLRRRRQAGVAA